jgi:hypothetical protein
MTFAPVPASVDAAASWLLRQNRAPSPIIPALQKRFGLTAKEAIDATREADLRKARAT